jgi:hypothetical protein
MRLPNFSAEYRPVIDSMVGTNHVRLEATAHLIVDVRGNGGGYTGSYASLTPLLYTSPIHFDGADVWVSPANIAHYRTILANTLLSTNDRALIQKLVSRMETHVGQFVEYTPDTTIRRDTVYRLPRQVAVLVDSGCASSCEDFVLEARQSAKVTVLGVEHTAGVHDYGEVRGVWLPGWRRMAMPTARARGPRIDNIGLTPAVQIPTTEPDAVPFARRYLHSSGRTQGELVGDTTGQAGYRDRYILANEARLYVADWGGRGPVLFFMPGFGNGAHIFDSVAPAFTDHFHVAALTPRGFPP